MNLLLVASLLQVRTKPVAASGHRADEGVGDLVLLLHAGGDFGMLLLDVSLKFVRAKSPGNSPLPAGDAEVVLAVLDPLDPLVDGHLVFLEDRSLGEADGTHVTLMKLLLEMDGGLVLGQIGSLAETQATSGTLNNISITTLFTPN